MGSGLTAIGLSGLNAAQAGMVTTGHNIANANTPGFNRQSIVQSTNPPMGSGAGFYGQGANVLTVQRNYNDFLNTQLQQAQTLSSQYDTQWTQLNQVNTLLGDPAAGLSPALQNFFNGVQTVANNASSVPARQSMLGASQTLVARFQALNQNFTDIQTGINGQISSTVALVNSYAQQIANLNNTIAAAQNAVGGQPANDLLDQRDQLISQLNQQVKATVLKQSDGSYNIFIGNGQPLVLSSQAMALSAVQTPNDPGRLTIAYKTGTNTTFVQESSIQGGILGGLLSSRSQTLDSAQNMLGRVAIVMAQTFNSQHQLGMDLKGALGTNYFNVASPLVQPANTNPAGTSVTATFGTAPTNNVSQLTGQDYTLQYNGAAWSLINNSTNAVVPMGGAGTALSPFTADGLNLVVTAPAAGQTASFLIRPTVNGARDISMAVSDPAKIAAAAPIIGQASLTNLGTGTITAGTVNQPVNPPPYTDPNLLAPVTITFNNPPTTFNVAGAVPAVGGPVAYTAGANISYNGWTVQINGAPNANDTFSVTSNSGAVSDNRNALLLGALQTQNTIAGNTTTYQGAFGQLVSQVGTQTKQAQVASLAQQATVTQVTNSQQTVSGVNLDEEAANLQRYQRAYQAAGKMLTIANTLFDTILAIK